MPQLTSARKLKAFVQMAEKKLGIEEGRLEHTVMTLANRLAGMRRGIGYEDDALQVELVSAARALQTTMQGVHTDFEKTTELIEPAWNEMYDTAEALQSATKEQIAAIRESFDGTKDRIDSALELEKYQSSESLSRVLAAMGTAQDQLDHLVTQQKEVIMPNIAAYRNEVERVCESLGISLDYERIARVAAESEATDDAHGVILSAEEEMRWNIETAMKALQSKSQRVTPKVVSA